MRPESTDTPPGSLALTELTDRAFGSLARPAAVQLRMLLTCGFLLQGVPVPVVLADSLPQTEGQGRYIVYLDPSLADRFSDASGRASLLEDWQARIGARISVERQLATGGWVLVLTSVHQSGSSDVGRGQQSSDGKTAQQALLERLEGVTSVEVDALMRRY